MRSHLMTTTSMDKTEDARDSFTLVDILRFISGLLLLNAFASWWFTSSSTWGYNGKWINPRYLSHIVTGNMVNLTLDELASYKGEDPNLPIYIAINGSVYDVTCAPEIYGPKGPYRFFSGRDSARAFVTGCFQNPEEFTYDLRGLDLEEAATDIRNWQRYFEKSSRYWYVGSVEHEPLAGEPPAPCKHNKYPNHQ